MNKKIVSLVLLLAVITTTITLILQRQDEGQSTQMPGLGSQGTISSSEFLNAEKAVEHYRELIRKHPDDVNNYVQLAQLYLQQGRLTGNNAEYLPKAAALLDAALEHSAETSEIVITKATIAATLHHFREAKELASKAIAMNPHTAFYYGLLCDANVELGNYDEAVRACDKMVSIRPDLRSYSRVSYLRELHGDIDGAIHAMTMAAEAGVTGQENRAWVLYNLGMLFLNQNKVDSAEYIFKGILQERNGYAHALRGLAKVQGMKGRYKESIEYYKQAIAALNEPAFHEGLGEVYQYLGNFSEMRTCYDNAEELYHEEQEMGENNSLEMAEFFASHNRNVEEALTLAQKAIMERKSVHGYYVLALALFKNGKHDEAWTSIQQAMKLGTKDASMLYLAGAIADKVGNAEQSKHFLTRALTVNPNFSFLYAADAKQILEKHKTFGSL
ncbi:MAG: tetratricopeptide repeat protein [Bacteroidetes bacterium]|nr:MAG: tetratricopeptide repeat protein [Bacteroidota bacterium]